MSAHVSADFPPILARPAPAAVEKPDERTQVASAVAYLLAFGVAIPVALLVGLLTLPDPAEPPADAAAGRRAEVVSRPAAGVRAADAVP